MYDVLVKGDGMLTQRSKAIELLLWCLVGLAAIPAPARAQPDGTAQIEDDLKAATADPRYAAIRDPRARLLAYWRDHLHARPAKGQLVANKQSAALGATFGKAEVIGGAAPHKDTPPPPTAPGGQFRFLLRQSFADVSIVSAPDPNAKATGAGISYSEDWVSKNTNWNVQGAVIGGYSYDFGLGPGTISQPSLRALSFGPYYTIDKVQNSSTKLATQNKDNETAGGLVEVGFSRTSDYYDWFRVKSGVVDDNIKGTSTFSSSLEWIPVYVPYLIHWPRFVDVPWGQFGFRFDPELVLQYDDSQSAKNKLLFSNKIDSFRVGPQLGLYLLPFPDVQYLNRLFLNLVYHPYYEAYSAKTKEWFQSNVTYNIDSAGTVGLTFTYQNGADETTGKQTNLYKVSLTSKLDYCSAYCPDKKTDSDGSN
jgi:hypothetical protein